MSSNNRRRVWKTGDLVKKSTKVKAATTNRTSEGNLVCCRKKRMSS